MKGTPVFVNVQQLIMTNGKLGLGNPTVATREPAESSDQVSPMVGAITSLLTDIGSPEVIFTLANASHIRVKLSKTSIQWLEKSQSQLNRYELRLNDGTLLYNGNATDPSFRQSFSNKIDTLLAAIHSNQCQVFVKGE